MFTSKPMSRRQFLRRAGAAAGLAAVPLARPHHLTQLLGAGVRDGPHHLAADHIVEPDWGGDEINAITSESDWQEAHFSPVELAVLHLTTELLTTRSVSTEVFDQVHTALGSEATVELLMVISRYAGLALMLNALQVDLDETARLPIPPRQASQ